MLAKITFGTGGMLDMCTGPRRHRHRPTPTTARSRSSPGRVPARPWGSRRSCCRPARTSTGCDDLEPDPHDAESHDVAAQCDDTDGVVFVPALLGLGTPHWDYGARGTLIGITRGSGRPHVVRAVLEGVAQRGADLVDAAEADTGSPSLSCASTAG